MNIGYLQINHKNEYDPPPTTAPSVEDPYLDPWVRWLDEMDLDDLGKDETE